jgi:hypothetical protein
MVTKTKKRGRPGKKVSQAAEDQGWRSADNEAPDAASGNSRVRQQFIEGTEPPGFAEIDEAAKNYLGLHNSRLKLKEKEDEANEALVAAMKEHGLEEYRFEGHLVSMKKSAEKAKVKRIDRETQAENEEDEDEDD